MQLLLGRSPAASLHFHHHGGQTRPCIAGVAYGGSSSNSSSRRRRLGHLQLQPPQAAGTGGDAELSLEQKLAAELAARQAAEAKAAESAAAVAFDGTALLGLLRQKYGRSYDVSLVQRTYLGKVFIALNIMWRYKEQQSFSYTEEEYMQRLDYVAAALVSWGVVRSVQSQLAATKERPRVGKAVSIMLDVPGDKAREWIAV
ncbi:hypothetical protein OEZ85_006495 [Tetradesmus obliquus]|uniref:Uncharacterized protein n=1 Tax=Tetradesmus obliquus TaxID=3088 RepID=A0ABY8TX52_TETOB|nr:hypothetical protein OEZ85_006495 [Tetradesmus obliquus]